MGVIKEVKVASFQLRKKVFLTIGKDNQLETILETPNKVYFLPIQKCQK